MTSYFRDMSTADLAAVFAIEQVSHPSPWPMRGLEESLAAHKGIVLCDESERLLGYIANVVSAAYRSSVHYNSSTSGGDGDASTSTDALLGHSHSIADSEHIYDEMLDSIVESSAKLEEKLQKRLPALQKEIDLMISSGHTGEEEIDTADEQL